MKRLSAIALTIALVFSAGSVASAQNALLKGLKNAAQNALNNAVNSALGTETKDASAEAQPAQAAPAAKTGTAVGSVKAAAGGPVYYVSAENGSNRADGLTPGTAKKDIQKALDAIADANQNGAVVRVAAGNYLGYLDAGYIEIKNFITLEGGWNEEFTSRDPFTNITRIQPTGAQSGTNGNKALITISGLDNIDYKVGGTLTIDGIMLDLGLENNYLPYDPEDPRTGSPVGCETGRLKDNPSEQLAHQLIHTDAALAGNLIVRNCLFLNGPYFGIQINTRCGEIEICNNVFIANRYAACRIDGWDKEGYRSHVNFHHNTVGFSWCRDKIMEDMGYGYEFMSKVSSDVHDNIFLCNNYAAVSRTHALSGPDSVIEAKRVTNLYKNYFYMNAADLQLPSQGGGKWTNVMVKQFDDVSEKTIPNIDGNKNLPADDALVSRIWAPYLEGFATLKVLDSSSSFDANSPANLYRQAHGMNMQGTEIHRVSMFANRYRFDEAMKLFGAKQGSGAQK